MNCDLVPYRGECPGGVQNSADPNWYTRNSPDNTYQAAETANDLIASNEVWKGICKAKVLGRYQYFLN